MPHKLKDPYRHKFNKAQYRLTNWPDYNEALKSRGKITIWFTEDIIKEWYYKSNKKKTPGREKTYSNLAIFTMRVFGTVYGQRLRQTEGLVEDIVKLMGLDLSVPDFTTLSRRMENIEVPDLSSMLDPDAIVNAIIDSTGLKIFGKAEWEKCKYNLKNQRKGWRKLHVVIDRKTNKIVSSELTTHHVGDPTPVPELLNKVNQDIASVTADGAYDTEPVYKSIADINATAIIPPRKTAALTDDCINNIPARATTIEEINDIGRQRWQKNSGYNWRSLVETTMSRYKKIIGTRVYSRKFENQKIESKIGCYILNKVMEFAMPKTALLRNFESATKTPYILQLLCC
jgi:hypothetical protein